MTPRLLILGLLQRLGPMHGYEIQRTLRDQGTSAWADVLPGSIYHALKQMARERLVMLRTVQHQGHRVRGVYAITADGRTALRRLVREALAELPRSFPAALYAALSFLDDLPRDEAGALLAGLARSIEVERERWDERPASSPRERAMQTNAREHLEADLRLVRALLGEQ